MSKVLEKKVETRQYRNFCHILGAVYRTQHGVVKKIAGIARGQHPTELAAAKLSNVPRIDYARVKRHSDACQQEAVYGRGEREAS